MVGFERGEFRFDLDGVKQIKVALGNLGVEGLTQNRQRFSLMVPASSLEINHQDTRSKEFSFQEKNDSIGLEWQVKVLIEQDIQSVKWNITLKNYSDHPVYIRNFNMLDHFGHNGEAFSFDQSIIREHLRFYSNGWQSWSTTGSYGTDEIMRRTRLGFLQEPMVINPDTPVFRESGRFSSDFFSLVVDQKSQCGFLLGFLSQRQHFGSISADFRDAPKLKMWANGDDARLDPGQKITTDWAVIYPFDLTLQDPFADFLKDVAAEHKIEDLPEPPAGWCSWYHYYQGISQPVIEDNLRRISEISDRLPLNLVQIDDGFQSQVGDWLQSNDRFPNGVKPLAQKIRDEGYTPGLWLAPFILHPRARTARDHPEWLLRHPNGTLVRTGFVWNSLGAALDLTHPGAMDYVREVIYSAVHQWGFPYLKLDFLYAAALKGRYQDATKTRAQVLRSGMTSIREIAGLDTKLVGCGAPLGSMLGLVEMMRIGPDVNSTWEPLFAGISLPFRDEPCMPSARNSIFNILTRAPLHNRWWVNDPDCLLIRSDSKLTLPEVQSLATAIAMTGGSVLVSDDMAHIPADRERILAALLPVMNRRGVVIDMLDEQRPSKILLELEGAAGRWHLVACFNWDNRKKAVELRTADFKLEERDYLVRSFWEGKIWRAGEGTALFSGDIAPHGVMLLAVRENENAPAMYLGSDLHISQGLEITSWMLEKNGLHFSVDPGKKMAGMVDLMLGSEPKRFLVNSEPAPYERLADDFYRIPVPHVVRLNFSVDF